MKHLFCIISLTAALIAMPVIAQQGPAGVPGAPGLAPPPPPPPAVLAPAAAQTTQIPRASADCKKAKNVAPCEARQEAQRKRIEACQGKVGAQYKRCLQKKTPPAGCSSSADPVRCERYRKARELCKDLPESAYRQCLRDNLTARK